MRTADWTLASSAHSEIERACRQERRARKWGLRAALLGLGFCPLTCVDVDWDSDVLPPSWAVLTTLGTLVALAAVSASLAVAASKRTYQKALRETYDGVSGWLVNMTVFQGAAPTGRDQGVVWFEGDQMMFLGARTSFALSHGMTRGTLVGAWPVSGLRSPHTLPLAHPTIRLSVGLEFIPPAEGAYPTAQGERALVQALRGWLARPGGGDAGEGSLPPLALGPDVPTPGALGLQAVAVVVAWSLVVAGTSWLAIATDVGPAALIFAFIGVVPLLAWPAAWTPRLCARAWRDRRALDRRCG